MSKENRTYIVTEMCPHCESEIEMRWDTDTMGFKAFCPVCGKRLMLCDECLHSDCGGCDYDSETDTCRFNPAVCTDSILRVETKLGTIIARPASDTIYPGIWIDLRRPGADCDMQVALIECTLEQELVTHVWSDAMQEEQTSRIVHKGIEEYFRVED